LILLSKYDIPDVTAAGEFAALFSGADRWRENGNALAV
jgi:hypothetical protein